MIRHIVIIFCMLFFIVGIEHTHAIQHNGDTVKLLTYDTPTQKTAQSNTPDENNLTPEQNTSPHAGSLTKQETANPPPATMGTYFWVVFMQNFRGDAGLSLDIAGEAGTVVKISIPGLFFQTEREVPANGFMRVDLPREAQIFDSGIAGFQGIQVQSDKPVAVYGVNITTGASADAFLGLPVSTLGRHYHVVSYPAPGSLDPSLIRTSHLPQYAIVSPYDNNRVTIVPADLTFDGQPAGEAFDVVLNKGETYMVRGRPSNAYDADQTGSTIRSELPVAVFSGSAAARIPQGFGYVDHLAEQLPPVSAWGQTHIVNPLGGRSGGDTWRFLAAEDNTTLMIDGQPHATLQSAGFYETIIDQPAVVETNAPILAVQFAHSVNYDNAPFGDPFMKIVPHTGQYVSRSEVIIPSDRFVSYINISLPAEGIAGMEMNGESIAPGVFSAVGHSGYAVATISVEPNSLVRLTNTADIPFGATVYGWGRFEAYEAYESYGCPAALTLDRYYFVTTQPNDSLFGETEGDGEYAHDQQVTVRAIPEYGYHFVQWTDNNEVVMEEDVPVPADYSFAVNAIRNFVAHFAINIYTIDARPDNSNHGSVTGSGEYEHGEQVNLVATPETGYHFAGWTEKNEVVMEGDVPVPAVYTFTATTDRELTANFDINIYTISAVAGNTDFGAVEGDGEYAHFEEVTLTAIPETGYHFVHWTENGHVVTDGDESAGPVYVFTAEEDRSLVAHFAINEYEITATPNNSEFGEVMGTGTYEHFQIVTLEAIPVFGYHFVHWTENGVVITGDDGMPVKETYTFMVESERHLEAVFQINTYTLTYVAGENGTIEGSKNQTVEHGSDGTPVEAIPDTGYHFAEWSDGKTENPRTDTNVHETLTVTARFSINIYTIAVFMNNPHWGTVTGGGLYEHFQDVALSAIPEWDYHFLYWQENGAVISKEESYVFMAEQNRNLTAVFSDMSLYDISIPNAFRPSSHNPENQRFVPRFNTDPQHFSMTVFDRWGSLVYETNDHASGWDGSISGRDAQAGAYVYRINYTDGAGISHEHTGVVTLIR